jgi:phosphoribosylformylglycinamidine cyclo-ligase
MCVGLVATDRVNVGDAVAPGDVIIGLRSTGIHCNGLTLARSVLLGSGRFKPTSHVDELGTSVGDELLVPTRIYVREVLDLLGQGLPIKAMINITSDGFLNLCRIRPAVGFRLDALPEPHAVFGLIQKLGGVTAAEMHRVFNMGIGFCLIAPSDRAVIEAIQATARKHGVESQVIGEVIEDSRRRVFIPHARLVGEGDSFTAEP